MFVRGFKTWCEEFSVQVRRELGLATTAPLDPLKLAKSLGIEVWTPAEVPGLPQDSRRRLLTSHADSWSAITVSHGRRRVIVHNTSHSHARQRSDLTHELAHIVLDHEPTQVFVSSQSGYALRTHDKNQEAEASWLAGCLLLPRTALLYIRQQRMTDNVACESYGVSRELLRYRFNVSGVDIQLKRVKAGRH